MKGAFTDAKSSSEGLFRAAEGGTIFLDEIGDMSSDMQAKILRTLNNGEVIPLGGSAAKKVDVRVIAATNVDIEEAIRTQKFRSDLLHRINTMEINIWPLFLRPGDLPILVYYFIREWNKESKGPEILAVTRRLLLQLILYRWPGNVRELKSLVERACIVAQNQPKNSTVLAALDVTAIPLGLSRDFMYLDKRWLNLLDEQVELPKLRTLDIRSHMQRLDQFLPPEARGQWNMYHKVEILTAERQSAAAGSEMGDARADIRAPAIPNRTAQTGTPFNVVPYAKALAAWQHDYTSYHYAQNGNNKAETARQLKVQPNTVTAHLKISKGASESST